MEYSQIRLLEFEMRVKRDLKAHVSFIVDVGKLFFTIAFQGLCVSLTDGNALPPQGIYTYRLVC